MNWRKLNDPPKHDPTDKRPIRVLGILKDGQHVFAQYTPYYLGEWDEDLLLWTSEGVSEKPIAWMPLPEPDPEWYEWAAVSDFTNDKGQAIIPWQQGWIMIDGALRRIKETIND